MLIINTRSVIRTEKGDFFAGELGVEYWTERGKSMEAQAYKATSEKHVVKAAIAAARCFARADLIKDVSDVLERERIFDSGAIETHPLLVGTQEAIKEFSLIYL